MSIPFLKNTFFTKRTPVSWWSVECRIRKSYLAWPNELDIFSATAMLVYYHKYYFGPPAVMHTFSIITNYLKCGNGSNAHPIAATVVMHTLLRQR